MKLFNTLSRQLEDFKPLSSDQVTVYTCGLTVYSQPHIGNWVAYIYWDILVRTLLGNGYNVNRVQNITDVGHLTSDEDAGEDKMLAGALREGKTAWQVAEKYILIADLEAYNKLGLIKPNNLPRATEFIEQQIDLIRQLETKNYTYVIDDGVYFDTSRLNDYGKLARLDIEGLQFGVRVEATGKKNPTDFALWKFSPKDSQRDMEWDSPWGKGFPGWHLECSVMARELLGDRIDIHTGGIDHIPVHHTNEIAQTEAVTGQQFSNYWLHANHIKVDGTKMSKSLGNIIVLDDIEQRGYDLEAFKLMILTKHYKTEGNFTWDILSSAQNRLNHWRNVADLRWQTTTGTDAKASADQLASPRLLDKLNNDLDTAGAVMAVDAYISSIEDGQIQSTAEAINLLGEELAQHLGINILGSDINDQQKDLLEQRSVARSQRDWSLSDKLRDQLAEQKIGLNDVAGGATTWHRL